MWLLAAFIALPIVEIALFIVVGGLIGLGPTLLLVIAAAILGLAVIRSQGFAALMQVQTSLDRLDDPAEPLAHGAMILLAGILLFIPGFFTDALGLALLVPAVRRMVYHRMRSRMRVQSFGTDGRHTGFGDPSLRSGGMVIDGEYEELDPDSLPSQPANRPSGWTRH